ncbi:MAG: N-6 DNA methylase [Halorientalis sp.]
MQSSGELLDPALGERYTSAARDALETDERVRAAGDAWTSFVRASHGDVFPDDVAPDDAFAEALTFDFLVSGLLDALTGATGVTVTNRDPRTNTDAFTVALGPLHERVLPGGRAAVRDGVTAADLRDLTPADLRSLYETAVPSDLRLALGEYYTPRAIADLTVEAVDPDPEATVLDPGCGAGAFLVATLDYRRASLPKEPQERVRVATDRVVGLDLNPVAVKAAKLAYGCALFDALTGVDRVELPVFLTDAVGISHDGDIRFRDGVRHLRADALVGNPPWVPWERVPEGRKEAWRERHVEDLGLQPHGGAAARLGHSNDDIAVPYAWTCIHRYLRQGGRAGFVLKRDPMRGPSGAVLRRLAVGERSLSLERVHDLAALDPFDVGANAAVYAFQADAEATFPVDATVWSGTAAYDSGEAFQASATATEAELVPLEPDDPTTAWVPADADRAALGDCAHEIRHGLKDDASAVFGLDRGDLDRVDDALVYPTIASRHVRPWGLDGHDLRLVPQRKAGEDNESWLRERYPDTHAYLADHRATLADRSSAWLDDGPFYTVFGLGEYTWAPYKLVWCRLGFSPAFAVVSTRTDPDLGERLVVPRDHYLFVPAWDRETAHFLCALCNSTPYRATLRDRSAGGKSGLSKAVVSELDLPAWPDTGAARRLAALSMRAHEAVREGADEAVLGAIERRVDRAVEAWLDGR